MAEIKTAKTAGFCFGVDRAVKLVYEELEKYGGRVATLGPIIHNRDVVEDLKKRACGSLKTSESLMKMKKLSYVLTGWEGKYMTSFHRRETII